MLGGLFEKGKYITTNWNKTGTEPGGRETENYNVSILIES